MNRKTVLVTMVAAIALVTVAAFSVVTAFAVTTSMDVVEEVNVDRSLDVIEEAQPAEVAAPVINFEEKSSESYQAEYASEAKTGCAFSKTQMTEAPVEEQQQVNYLP